MPIDGQVREVGSSETKCRVEALSCWRKFTTKSVQKWQTRKKREKVAMQLQ